VFNYPVSFTVGGLTVTYRDDLINPDLDGNDLIDAAFDSVKSAGTALLDPTGTIVTITSPAGGFPKNETITVDGITATVNGFPSFFEQAIYVEDNTSTGLKGGMVLTADNYNGSSSGGGSALVYLEFPEYVTGTYQVISGTAAGVPFVSGGGPITIGPNPFSSFNPVSGQMVFTDGTTTPACTACGTGAGVFFRVPVMTDNIFSSSSLSLADGDTLRVAVDVTDATGNRLAQEVVLTIQ
jgi:hypothetical protein